MNPCPCGFYGDSLNPCTCAPATVTKYQKRIFGPLQDRIDIEVLRVDYEKLSGVGWGRPVSRFALLHLDVVLQYRPKLMME